MIALAVKLDSALDREERLYRRFLKLMQEEVGAVEGFAPEKLESLAQKREEVLLEVAGAVDSRTQIQNDLLREQGVEPGENATLSEVVQLLPDGKQKQELLVRLEPFKKLVKEVHVKANELNRLVGWSMNIVNGSLSILRSSAVDEVKGYSRSGSENSSYHPRYGRSALNLKEA